jgi:hypothetical protein
MPNVPVAPPARPLLRFSGPALALLMMVLVPAARAQVWSEVGDAGDLVSTAQATVGSGGLTAIHGFLASPMDVDLYCIRLSAVPPAGQPLIGLQCAGLMDPSVWLFDAAGQGVFTNETCAGGNKTILAPSVSLAPGTYYVAVSYFGVGPSSAGGAIWLSALPGQRAPDGPGAAGPLAAWTGIPTVSPLNPYLLSLTLMQYCDAATAVAPSTWGALRIRYGS